MAHTGMDRTYLQDWPRKQDFNFSGLSVTPTTTPPRIWDPKEKFLELVALKLYMFVPAIICGVLLGLFFWILTLIVIRMASHAKKRFRFSINSDRMDFALEEG